MYKWVRAVLAICLVVVSVEVSALEMEVIPGFGGKAKPGTWTPITVRLKNTSQERFSGTITTIDPAYKKQHPYGTSFDLPGRSEKQYTHYLLQHNLSSQVTVKLVLKEGRVPDPQKLVMDYPLSSMFQGTVLFVVAGSDQAALGFLEGQRLTYSQPGTGIHMANETIATAIINQSLLPDKPLGYDSVDMLVLSDFSPGLVDTKQLTALKMWVAYGGLLIVNGGPNFQLLQNEFYRDLLPIDAAGVVETADLSGLSAKFGYSFSGHPSILTTGKLRPGADVIVEQNGIPLISKIPYGLGEVILLAFDYTSSPVRGWEGQSMMWKSLFLQSKTRWPMASPSSFLEPGGNWRPMAPPAPGSTPTTNQGVVLTPVQSKRFYRCESGGALASNPIDTIAGNMPSISLPSMRVIVFFLLAYLLCLVPINYFILTRQRRRELAWITTPMIIIVFTIGAYGLGYAMKGSRLMLKTVTVVEAGENARYGSATSYGGIFSPARRTYGIEVTDPYAVISEAVTEDDPSFPGHRRGPSQARLKILFGEMAEMPDIPMDMWSMRTFRIESACDLEGAVTSDLRLIAGSDRRLVGTIKNNTKYNMSKCRLIAGQSVESVADIPAGGSVKVNISVELPAIITPPSGVPTMPIPGQTPVVETTYPVDEMPDTQQELENWVLMNQVNKSKTMLVGRLSGQPYNINLKNGREERDAACCFIIHLAPPEGGVSP